MEGRKEGGRREEIDVVATHIIGKKVRLSPTKCVKEISLTYNSCTRTFYGTLSFDQQLLSLSLECQTERTVCSLQLQTLG